MNAYEIFAAAIKLSGMQRTAFLAAACDRDVELLRQVEQLLAAHDDSKEVLPMPTTPRLDATFLESSPLSVGTIIAGRYKLLQEIGEGGMGSVFMADQLAPVKRRVAIKVIKPGMDSTGVLARFEAERQALALMDHPNIAKVLDAGTSESGRPFFVMELVKGVPLNQFCDHHKLSLPERLNLFIHVCSAVQHAHQKGIIHRDLKPTNILVESHDGFPVPKVIDFGLAKAMGSLQLTDNTLFTALGSIAGTPLYMAPEQATFNAVDVDTRTDVYALGVILYELLTGTTPIERETFQKGALDEMLRIIREQEPPIPSLRFNSSATQASVAAQRQMEPVKLGRFIRGEVDWIVMKSLAKERDRRYESATALANDVERFLHHEPVLAGPPSTTYKIQKFVRRNRLQVAAAACVLLALFAGIGGTTYGLIRAENARRSENNQRSLAEQRAEDEKSARLQAEEVSRFMQSVFAQGSAVGQATRERIANPDLTVKEAMRFASKTIVGKFKDRPEIEAALRDTIGAAFRDLGAFDEAENQLIAALQLREESLGADRVATLNTVNSLAKLYWLKGDYERALPLAKRGLEGRERLLGPAHPDTLQSVNNLGFLYSSQSNFSDAERLLKRAIAGREKSLGANHPETLESVNNLGMLYWSKGDADAAKVLYQRASDGFEQSLGAEHPYTLSAVTNLALLYRDQRDLARAEPLLKQVLRSHEKTLGSDHPDTLRSVNNLAMVHLDQGDVDSAESLFKRALEGCDKSLDVNNPLSVSTAYNLAALYFSKGDHAAVEPLLKRAIEGRATVLGEEHPDTQFARALLGVNYKNAGRLNDAIPLLEQAYQSRKRFPQLTEFGHPLLEAYVKANRRDQAVQLGNELATDFRERLPPDNVELNATLGTIGFRLLDIDPVAAEQLLRECLANREKFTPDHWGLFQTKSLLGASLLKQKKYDEAEPLLLAGYEGLERRIDQIPMADRELVADAGMRLRKLFEENGKPEAAATLRKLPRE